MEYTGNTELNFCYNCMTRMASGQTVCPVCGHDNSRHQNPEDALPEGAILAGKYLVGKVLGQGGFGITYLGFDTALKVRVAIKEYFPSGACVRSPHSIRVTAMSSQTKAESFRKGCDEFQTEAERLAAIESPNIVKVRDYFRENGTAYIVMNYLDGNSLTKEAAACGGRIPWQRVVGLFNPLIPELYKLHQMHLMHRDIKPDNLKIVKDGERAERLVLLDFGAARNFVSAEVTGTYTAMLTPGYAPVEQYSPKGRQGPYTDIYALCATMYAVLTGILPPAATDRMTGDAEIKTFSSMGVEMPPQIEKAILHGLEVRAADRPQSMMALYDELNGKTAAAQKPEPGLRKEEKTDIRKPSGYEKTKKKAGWLLPALLGVVLLGAGFFIWRGIRQNQLNGGGVQTTLETPGSQQVQQTDMPGNVSASADLTATAQEQREIEFEQTASAFHVTETEAAGENTRQAMEMEMTRIAAETEPAGPPAVLIPEATNTPEPTAVLIPEPTNTSEPTAVFIPEPTNLPEPTAAPAKQPVSVGTTITFGTFEQNHDLTDGPEAIEWQVLAVEEGRALVISKYGLATKPYTEKDAHVTWETSTLRAWLNGEFFNSAFSEEEKGQIREVMLNNPDNATSGAWGGNNTSDRIFLLSIDEANLFFVDNESRSCMPTKYAEKNGAQIYQGKTWWWLRSPGNGDTFAALVDTKGFVSGFGNFTGNNGIAVRPAFWLDLPEDMTAAAVTGMEPIAADTPAPDPAMETVGVKAGDIITLGRYEQDGDLTNGAEAVEWQVLAVEEARALVISRYGLAVKPYNESFANVTWETCSLRAWLNGEFFNSVFSAEEKGRIREVMLGNPDNEKYRVKGGNDTADRIFLLSIDEVNRFFADNVTRQCQPSAAAKNTGAYVSEKYAGMTWWWLRSPGESDLNAAYVDSSGSVIISGSYVFMKDGAARPAFWLDL